MSVIDRLREKEDKDEDDEENVRPTTFLLTPISMVRNKYLSSNGHYIEIHFR
jgi:hypothetical protein